MAKTAAELGELITERMTELGIGQQELSLRSGVSVSTLRRLQRGIAQRRNPATLAAVAKALGWPESYLREDWEGVGGAASSDLEARVANLEREVREMRARRDE